MQQSNEGSAFQIGLAINDLLNLEGFPSVENAEEQGIKLRRDLSKVEFLLCYALAYRIFETNQNNSNS